MTLKNYSSVFGLNHRTSGAACTTRCATKFVMYKVELRMWRNFFLYVGYYMGLDPGRSIKMSSKKVRLVLAEDHHVVRAALVTFLNQQPDFEVVGEAADGCELYDILKATQPDVLVMDTEMPHHQPVAAAWQIKRKHPHTQILVLSDDNRTDDVLRLIAAGATGYVLKYDPAVTLIEAISAVSQGLHWYSLTLLEVLKKFNHYRKMSRQLHLTKRQVEILQLMVQGHSNRAIAAALQITEKTIKNHINRIYAQLRVKGRAQAIEFALLAGLVTPEDLSESHICEP
jgi:DNA-binding NarL/FixJ family response regulator